MNTRIQLQAGRSSLPSLAILFGLALISFNIFAQAPNPPTFTALDGQELDPNPDGRYSLDDATRGLPFTVDTPTPPQIIAEHTVTPSTIGNYINTPGMRLILESGNYGNLSIGGTDKEIVFTTGVIVNVLTISGQRIVVSANPARTGTFSHFWIGDGAADVLFDGVYSNSTSTGGESNLIWVANRVGIINSRLRANDNVLGSYPNDPNGPTNLIIGNNELISFGGAQAAIRLQSARNLAFVDNRVDKASNATFRLHTSPAGQKADNLYVARNQFEGAFWQIRPIASGSTVQNTLGMGSVWIEDNTVYFNDLWWINFGQESINDFPEVFICRNNNAYIGSGGWPNARQYSSWTATIENNTVQPYTAPPAWEHQ